MSAAAVDLVAALVAVDMEGPTAVGLAAVILVAASAAADMAGTPATSGTAVRMVAAAAVIGLAAAFRRDQRDRRDLRGGGHNYGAGGFYRRGGDDGWRRPRPPKALLPPLRWRV